MKAKRRLMINFKHSPLLLLTSSIPLGRGTQSILKQNTEGDTISLEDTVICLAKIEGAKNPTKVETVEVGKLRFEEN